MSRWMLLLLSVCLLLSVVQCAECALDGAPDHAETDDIAPALRAAALDTRGLVLDAPQPVSPACSTPPAQRIPRPPIA
jgi:hypothetical protein